MKAIYCNEMQFNTLVNLVNAGVRAAGLQAVRDAAVVLDLLESAVDVMPPAAAPVQADLLPAE